MAESREVEVKKTQKFCVLTSGVFGFILETAKATTFSLIANRCTIKFPLTMYNFKIKVPNLFAKSQWANAVKRENVYTFIESAPQLHFDPRFSHRNYFSASHTSENKCSHVNHTFSPYAHRTSAFQRNLTGITRESIFRESRCRSFNFHGNR